MTKLFIKPTVEGSIVRNPDNGAKPLAAEGEEVNKCVYWQRRINDGSVVVSKKPPKSTKGDK